MAFSPPLPHTLPVKVTAQNRRARFDFEITDTVEAGLILTGQEAKSCRGGHVNLAGAYVSFLGGKPVIKHMKISPYAFATVADYDPERDRPLLLSKREAEKLEAVSAQKGMSIVPLEVRAGKFIKILLGIGRGRKRLDKRQAIKDREIGRKIREGKEI